LFARDAPARRQLRIRARFEGRIDLNQLLSWLPADTESVQVANGLSWMSNFQIGQEDSKNREVTTEELEKHFAGLTLQSFKSSEGLLEKNLERKPVSFALWAWANCPLKGAP
jgi:hypothetical protein